FSRLETVAISQASADQRAGRAGRVAEGWTYRLWPQSQRLEPQRRPEIAQVELASLALELAAWGSDALRFVDPPPPGPMAAARELLQRLDALDAGGRISAQGRRMLALGTHPRLAAMLLAARDDGERALACDLAALVEARDPLRSRSDGWRERWLALAGFRRNRVGPDAHRATLATIDAAARQWRRRLGRDPGPPPDASAHALGGLLAHAFPDRIGRRHASDALRFQLANGRMARLHEYRPAGVWRLGAPARGKLPARRWLGRRQRAALRASRFAAAARRAGGRGAAARSLPRALHRTRRSALGRRAPRPGRRARAPLRRHRARCTPCRSRRPGARSAGADRRGGEPGAGRPAL